MNNLKVFKNEEFGQVRALEIKGEPYLVGKDVTDILGYQNGSKALADHVDDYDKLNNKSLSSLGQRGGWLINESGLYSLILSSKLPTAKKFKRWVTSEVLPQIRKTGGYIGIESNMTDDEIMAKALLVAQNTINRKNELLQAKEKELTEVKEDLNSKNNFINQISVSENSLKVEEVAQLASKKGINIGRNRLWEKLREWGFIKKNSKFDPKQLYVDRGYFEIVEGTKASSKGVFVYKTTRVLGKGQVYIINRLLEEQKEDINNETFKK